VFLVALGAAFIGNALGFLHFSIAIFWPVLLIAIGVMLLVRRLGPVYDFRPFFHGPWWNRPNEWHRGPGGPPPGAPSSFVDSAPGGPGSSGAAQSAYDPGSADSKFRQVAVLSGFKRHITSQDFKYAHVSAVLGGFALDLTRAAISGDEAVVEVSCVLGGGEIRIPDTWKLIIMGDAIGGAYSDETYQQAFDPAKPPKRLVIRGAVVFGGVVIKN
jgi:hypothetical protein